jgi:glycosyltransferase involved in cell wall biosynthesis
MLPHPVEPTFALGECAEPKSRQVVCVGRWQDHLQKRPLLMQAVLQALVEKDSAVQVEIIGTLTSDLERWHQSLRTDLQNRVHLRGRVDRGLLATILRRSQVFYSPSAYESFGIAAGEALCCGCSVVAKHSVSMATFDWFVSKESGRLVATDDVEGHLGALEQELACWEQGDRTPSAISESWCDLLHADRVAGRILNFRF